MLRDVGVEATVGLVSHVGGHKFAGNVIIYLPPDQGNAELSGAGVWYGRVGPEHIDGIVRETMVNGRIVGDLFRGGVTASGVDLGRVVEAQLKIEDEEAGGGLKLKPKARWA